MGRGQGGGKGGGTAGRTARAATEKTKTEPKAAAKAPAGAFDQAKIASKFANDLRAHGVSAALANAAAAVGSNPSYAKAVSNELGRLSDKHEGSALSDALQAGSSWFHMHANITGNISNGARVDPHDLANRTNSERGLHRYAERMKKEGV